MGAIHSIIPDLHSIFYVSLIAYLGFKFFSPSKDDVSIKHIPSYDVYNTIRSADIISNSSIFIISPTNTSFHVFLTNP